MKNKIVKNWDFRTPKLLSENQKLGFKELHRTFFRTFENILITKFSGKTSLNIEDCDQYKYDDFIGENKDFTFLLEEKFETQGKMYKVFLIIDPTFYSMLLDKMLGGKAKIINKINKITEIEEVMLTKEFYEIFYKLFPNTKSTSTIIGSYLEAFSLCDNLNRNGIMVKINISIDNIVSPIKIFYPSLFIQGRITNKT